MAYELITERNLSEGLHVIFIYANDVTGGLLMNLVIFGFYIVMVMGVYYSQKRTNVNGDIPQCMAVGGFATSILAVLCRLVPGLISGYTLAIVIALTLIGTLWFLFSEDYM